jgi:Predicted phage phi-C31 gp36 major capsid-like protein
MQDIARECQELLDLADSESRMLSDEEREQLDRLNHEFQALELMANASERFDTFSAQARGQGRKTTAEGPGAVERRAQGVQLGGVSSGPLDSAQLRNLQRQPFRGRSYGELFGASREPSAFTNVGEFFDSVINNKFDPRLIRAGMTEGVESDGGYFVPTEYAQQMLDAALEQSVLYGRVRVEPMASREKLIGAFDNSDNSTGTPYGLTLQWLAETGQYSETKAKVKQIRLVAHKSGVLVPYSVELSEDSPNFAAMLQGACASAIGWGIDDVILSGNGAGKPLGILNSDVLLSVQKETGQLAGTIQFENVAKMYARMHPSSIANAIWLANPSTLPQLLSMAVPLGSGGQWTPVLTDQVGVYMLLGRPLFLTEKCAGVGTQGDIMFVDPAQYVVGLRRDITVQLDPYSKFNTDEIVLKVNVRIAGQPIVDEPFKMKHGGTVAPFVACDTRA